MSLIKNALEEIENCTDCRGHGYIGWSNSNGDYDIEYCECNPHKLPDPLQP